MAKALKKQKQVPFAPTARLLRGYGLNCVNLAQILECCPNTALKKLNNPEQLTLSDLRRISRLAHVPAEEIRESLKFCG